MDVSKLKMHPWKKTENQNGLPLYINESTKEKQWDHPKFSDIRQRLDDCNYVKYSSYRVALKLRVLQQALLMDQVPLTVVEGVFERHKLGANECSLNLDCYDIEAILYDIYFACNKRSETSIDIDMSTELMLNLLLNVYDRSKTGKVQVLSSKLILGILSSSNLTDLYRFLFALSADHNNCITRLKFQMLLKKITEIINFLHEDANFGQHLISSSTENCFSNSPGLVGITESAFMSWLEKGSTILSWAPILSRIKLAEQVLHNNVCSSCNLRPFAGLRYRCLKCTNYIQCQRCFFSGQATNSHKISHSMREYCTETDGRERNYIFIKKLLRLLTCASRTCKSSMPFIDTNISRTTKSETLNIRPSTDEMVCDITPLSSPLSQLQMVIRQLEQQNRDLNAILYSGNHNAEQIKQYLENHRAQVSTQINKLKVLREFMKLSSNTISPMERLTKDALHSTPMVPNGRLRPQKMEIGVLSPIAQLDEHSKSPISTRSRDLYKTKVPTVNATLEIKHEAEEYSTMQYSLNDISTWIGGNPSKCQDLFSDGSNTCRGREIHTDLDDALAKLQQILANNFTLDESLVTMTMVS
ncbi:hypothetical protein HHI36_001491 [Cryptolaemus montrouzieri]|uniref:Dystrophin n=1 Tax=Cryptolaemus montrouzieri TaxID=559131 RepID=A0ABD2P835_9CUCU